MAISLCRPESIAWSWLLNIFPMLYIKNYLSNPYIKIQLTIVLLFTSHKYILLLGTLIPSSVTLPPNMTAFLLLIFWIVNPLVGGLHCPLTVGTIHCPVKTKQAYLKCSIIRKLGKNSKHKVSSYSILI